MDKKQISLAELRLERGLSQRELAKRINVSSGIIGMYETGSRTPSLDKALRISSFFGVPIENIIFASLDNNPDDFFSNVTEKKKDSAKQCYGQISMFTEK